MHGARWRNGQFTNRRPRTPPWRLQTNNFYDRNGVISIENAMQIVDLVGPKAEVGSALRMPWWNADLAPP